MFSLGKQGGQGYAAYEAYLKLKAAEKDRPVIYEGAGAEWNTDFVVGRPDGRNASDRRFSLTFASPGSHEGRTALENATSIAPGSAPGDVTIHNGFRVANLKNFRVGYQIVAGAKRVVAEGICSADIPPRETGDRPRAARRREAGKIPDKSHRIPLRRARSGTAGRNPRRGFRAVDRSESVQAVVPFAAEAKPFGDRRRQSHKSRRGCPTIFTPLPEIASTKGNRRKRACEIALSFSVVRVLKSELRSPGRASRPEATGKEAWSRYLSATDGRAERRSVRPSGSRSSGFETIKSLPCAGETHP